MGIFGQKILPKKPEFPVQSSLRKTLRKKKPKTDRTLDNRKMKRDSLQKNFPQKNGQHFPLNHIKNPYSGRSSGKGSSQLFRAEFQGILRPALGMRWSLLSSSIQLSSIAQRASKAKKKNPGSGTKQECVSKMGPEGAEKTPPLRQKRSRTQCRRGSL